VQDDARNSAGRAEVSYEATKSTKEGEDGRGRRLPPPLKLWRTGHAEVMRSAFLSVALCRLGAAARGAPRRDGRALLIVEAAAARSAACEGKCGPGGGAGQ
jgi:hypothetical protein